MRTQTKYEEIILAEIRTLPPPVLPQAVKMLRSLREGVKSAAGRAGRKSAANTADTERTGFCGVWKDDHPADEILADITTHRSGYGRRKVDL
jgi:hypothetical protein